MRRWKRSRADHYAERERAALGWTDQTAQVVLITVLDDRDAAVFASRGWSPHSTAITPGFPGYVSFLLKTMSISRSALASRLTS